MEEITLEEYQKTKEKKPFKYGNKKTILDGHTFDSAAEAERYKELRQLEKVGVIQCLQLQPVFELQPKFKLNGKTIRSITYRGDFAYFEGDNQIVEDLKGVRTETFNLKEKMMRFLYPHIDFRIVNAKKPSRRRS